MNKRAPWPVIFLVSPRTAKCSVKLVLVQRLFQCIRLHQLGVLLAVLKRVYADVTPLFIGVDQQIQAELLPDIRFAKLDHFAKLPRRINMKQRKRRLCRIKCFQRQLDHDRRVFANRVEHDRVVKLGRHFPDNVDALGFQLFQVR